MGMNDKRDEPLPIYSGCTILLTTKHQKSAALSRPFEQILGARIEECVVDTDQLGTFSGEVDRKGSQLETVRAKCEWGMQQADADYGLASEGSFGPHPIVPFAAAHREMLYFIDKKRQFQLCVTDLFTETNYQTGFKASLGEVMTFAEEGQFPSHALIIRPHTEELTKPVFKGIQTIDECEAAFFEAQRCSPSGQVWVETDMRAHLNPTRMRMIETLGEKMANRLTCYCPQCYTPGWGKVDIETGLPCDVCDQATTEIKSDIYACAKCDYTERVQPSHGRTKAEPVRCGFCNP